MRIAQPSRLSSTAFAVALLVLTAACGGNSSDSSEGSTDSSSEKQKTEKVRVMMFPGQAYRLPIKLAEQEGYFEDRGITIEAVDQPSGIQGMQGLEATHAQVGHLSISTVGQGWQAGTDAAYFCGGIDVTQTTLMAAPGTDLPSTEDGASWQEVLKSLEGKKIGIQTPVGSGLQLLFAEALREAGVKNVTYVNLGGTNTTTSAALGNGSVDVAQVNPPATQVMLSKKEGKPLAYLPQGPSAYQDYYGSALVAPRKWLEEKPETAAAFCEAVQKGLDFIADPGNAEASQTMLEKDTGVPSDAAKLVVEQAYDDFSTELSEDVISKTLEAYVKLGILKADPAPTYESLVVVPKN